MSLILYLVQVTCCLTFFYTFFHYLLQKETLFETNRFYLITSLVLSISLPLLKIYVDSRSAESAIVVTPYVFVGAYLDTFASANTLPSVNPFPWEKLIMGIYFIGVAFMAIRFINAVKEILVIRRQGMKTYVAGIMCILSDKVKSPFSFFNTIYLPASHAFNEAELEEVITHEMAHVRRRHTLDVLFIELACVFLWPSPLIYFYRKALKEVHEYVADAAVTKDTPWENYAQLLLGQQQGQLQNVLSNQLIYSQLKKRLIMMNQKRSGAAARYKYLGFIPVLLVALVLFSFREKMPAQIAASDAIYESSVDRVLMLTVRPDQKMYFGLREVSKSNLESVLRSQIAITRDTLLLVKILDPDIVVADLADIDLIGYNLKIRTVFTMGASESDRQSPVFPGCAEVAAEKQQECGMTKMMEYIQQHMAYPESVKKAGIEGNVIVKFTVGVDGLIKNIEVVKSLHPDADKAVVSLVSDMNVKAGKWLPATKQGMNQDAEMHLPVKFALDIADKIEEPLMYAEELPRFPGCENMLDETERSACSVQKMYEFIYDNISYPQQDKDNKIEGQAIVQFVIGVDGSISDIDVKRSPSEAMKEEVIRMMNVMAAMPEKWIPARQDGKAVAMRFTLPVKFMLQDKVEQTEAPTEKISDAAIATRSVQVVPNPAMETITVSVFEDTHTLRIADLSGQQVKSQKVSSASSGSETVDISSLKPGQYVVQVISDKESLSASFTVLKK